MATIQQKPGEAYLHKARRYCSSKLESLRDDPEYRELAELTGQPMAQKINPQIVRKAVR